MKCVTDAPLLSIVTATLNRRDLLEQAIKSVVAQGLEDVEHIIIDGVSTDGTLGMLQQFTHLTIISEPDKNLYDAWNKGISRARGRFICILNSDDRLPPGSLDEIRKLARLHPEADLISGPVELGRPGDGEGNTLHLIDDPDMVALREQDISAGVPLTNGRVLARKLFEKIGLFDLRYPVVSDRQFFLRVLQAKAINITTNVPLYRYKVHAQSLTLNDKAPSADLARECQIAALDGIREAGSGTGADMALRPEQAAYRRWFAWSTFYLCYLMLRAKHPLRATQTALEGLKTDPFWFSRVLPILWRHLTERKKRLGRLQQGVPTD